VPSRCPLTSDRSPPSFGRCPLTSDRKSRLLSVAVLSPATGSPPSFRSLSSHQRPEAPLLSVAAFPRQRAAARSSCPSTSEATPPRQISAGVGGLGLRTQAAPFLARSLGPHLGAAAAARYASYVVFLTSAGNEGGLRPLVGRASCMLALLVSTWSCTEKSVPRSGAPGSPRIDIDLCAEAQRCRAFPDQPIVQGPMPANVETLFQGEPADHRGVCLIEPPDGALFPKDGLPPRFRFEPMPGEDLWRITLSSRPETHELVVYTTRPQWTMDEVIWRNLTTHIAGRAPVSVSVRGIDSNARETLSETRASFEIAPVEAGGTIVYWAANGAYNAGGETKLVGFQFGRAETVDVLKPEDVEESPTLDQRGKPKAEEGDDPAMAGRVRCIGCHASTPGGDAVAFVDAWPWNSVVASIVDESVGKRPAYVTQAASRILQ